MAALNDSSESLKVTETGNAFQTVATAWTKVQSPAAEWDLLWTSVQLLAERRDLTGV